MNVEHLKQALLPEECVDYMKRLKKQVPWQKMKWGRGYLPRLIYRVDGGIPEPIQDLITYTEASFECSVRGVWCNYYQSGNDYTPPHQDNYGSYVITYSFGSSRRFVCQNLNTAKKTEYMLNSGDIFVFSPEFDKMHKHSIPKTTKLVDPRISIVLFTDIPYSQSHWAIEKPLGGDEDLEFILSDMKEGEMLVFKNLMLVKKDGVIMQAIPEGYDQDEDLLDFVAKFFPE